MQEETEALVLSNCHRVKGLISGRTLIFNLENLPVELVHAGTLSLIGRRLATSICLHAGN